MMGNTTFPSSLHCGTCNVTVAFMDSNPFLNSSLPVLDNSFYPINTFSFFNAFILFCIQGLIFKPISRILKRRSGWYKATFYPGDKLFNNDIIAHVQRDSESMTSTASKPFLSIDSENHSQQRPQPAWAVFLLNNVMCFCDPLFAACHTVFHLIHFCYLVERVLVCNHDGDDTEASCFFVGRPWLLYQSLYIRFVMSGCPTFFSLFLFSCSVHEGGVFVGFKIRTFKRFKWHGLCLFINFLLLLPAIITHSIPMLVVYSPFVLALCLSLAAAFLSLTWILNQIWENLSCCSQRCDGRAILLVMQVIMKVLRVARHDVPKPSILPILSLFFVPTELRNILSL